QVDDLVRRDVGNVVEYEAAGQAWRHDQDGAEAHDQAEQEEVPVGRSRRMRRLGRSLHSKMHVPVCMLHCVVRDPGARGVPERGVLMSVAVVAAWHAASGGAGGVIWL